MIASFWLSVVVLLCIVGSASAQTTRPGRSWLGSRNDNKPASAPVTANAELAAKAATTRLLLTSVRAQMELYCLQHKDHYPTVAQLADWRVLTHPTNEEGVVVKADAPQAFGPYLQMPPANPFTGMTKLSAPEKLQGTTGWTMKMEQGSPHLYVVVPDLPVMRALFDEQTAVFSNQVSMARPTTAPAPRHESKTTDK